MRSIPGIPYWSRADLTRPVRKLSATVEVSPLDPFDVSRQAAGGLEVIERVLLANARHTPADPGIAEYAWALNLTHEAPARMRPHMLGGLTLRAGHADLTGVLFAVVMDGLAWQFSTDDPGWLAYDVEDLEQAWLLREVSTGPARGMTTVAAHRLRAMALGVGLHELEVHPSRPNGYEVWAQTGWPPENARWWYASGDCAEEALLHAAAGWTPEQVTRWRVLSRALSPGMDVSRDSELERWFPAPLSPVRALAYLAAGFAVDEATQIEQSPEPISDADLAAMAGLTNLQPN